MSTLIERAKHIELVIFDVDGVLTDGSLYVGDDGQEYKAFNSKDGHGIRMLHQAGVRSAILTGRSSEVVKHRARDLNIDLVLQGHRDKRPAFTQLLEQTGLERQQIAYVGDDVVDLPVMVQVGFAIAVNDAHALVKRHAHWTTGARGGRGAAREVCEFLLDARGRLDEILASYLS
ncbi:MAG: KdsC family phosphatase [Thiotrichales bacterium]